jgi:hypothetical protein
MIHDWFMNFGGIALLLAVITYFGTRTYLKRNPARNSEDKQGRAIGFFAVGALSALFLFIGFVLVAFGVSGAIPGYVGFTLGGFALALLASN